MVCTNRTYHIQLENPRKQIHMVLFATYHQCLQALWTEKKNRIPTSKSSFKHIEVCMIELIFFEEFSKERKHSLKAPMLPVPKWENLTEGSTKKCSRQEEQVNYRSKNTQWEKKPIDSRLLYIQDWLRMTSLENVWGVYLMGKLKLPINFAV